MDRKREGVFDEIDRMRAEVDRLFRTMSPSARWLSPSQQRRVWCPPTDVYETDSCIVVKVEIAGMDEEDFDISYTGRTLVIAGYRHDPSAKLAYQRMEISYGEFRTDVHVPGAVVEDAIEAKYEDGFLIVTLPKPEGKKVSIVS
ncbi:MAG: Hsp20/alpha crystallin family protein [Anaerolineae bacterium]